MPQGSGDPLPCEPSTPVSRAPTSQGTSMHSKHKLRCILAFQVEHIPAGSTLALVATPTALAGVFTIEPKVFGDARGFFFESFNLRDFRVATATSVDFVQDNHSLSQ